MRCARRIIIALAAAASSAALAQSPLVMPSTVVDALNSGDCKALADIDLDGKADPIIAGSSLVWYESGASFAPHTIRAQVVNKEFTTDMQAADVDGDGDVDIIVGDGAGVDNVLWFENPRINGPQGPVGNPRIGTDWVLHIIGTHGNTVHDIETADMDGDGALDVVTSGHGFTRVWKRTGNAWANHELGALTGGRGVCLGDINRNGILDIATPTGWLRNPGALIGVPWVRFPISGTDFGDECLLVDLDRDGRLDLVTCDAHTRGPVYWFLQPADGTSPSWTRRLIDASMAAHHPEAADFNADGRPDLLMGLELAEVAVYLNWPGSPVILERHDVASTGGHNARVGDMNGDGRPDILACDYIGNPPVTAFLNAWCYPNCDGTVGAPILTVNDFSCFMNAFAGALAYANCDASRAEPTLNVMDFQCFIGRFAQGCP